MKVTIELKMKMEKCKELFSQAYALASEIEDDIQKATGIDETLPVITRCLIDYENVEELVSHCEDENF